MNENENPNKKRKRTINSKTSIQTKIKEAP